MHTSSLSTPAISPLEVGLEIIGALFTNQEETPFDISTTGNAGKVTVSIETCLCSITHLKELDYRFRDRCIDILFKV
jgi:hypothetical protein